MYKLMKTGLASASIWSFFDMGKRQPWPGAREQIIRDGKFAEKRNALKKAEIEREKKQAKSP